MKIKETVTAPLLVLTSYILFAACYILPWVRNALLRSGDYDLLSGIVLELMVLLIPALMYAKLKGAGYSAEMHFAALRPSGLIFALCMVIIALTGAVLLAMGLTGAGIIHSKYLLTDTYDMGLADRELSVFLRCMNCALVPAVAEELLYRGVLVTEYRKSGAGTAILFSSALYAMSQFEVGELPVYFFLGVVFSLIYYVTRSLPLTVFSRLVFNLLVFYFEDAGWTLILKKSNFVFLVSFCAILFLLAAALALSEAQRLYYTRGIDGEKTPEEGKLTESVKVRLLTAVLSPSFLLCIGVFVAVIVGI